MLIPNNLGEFATAVARRMLNPPAMEPYTLQAAYEVYMEAVKGVTSTVIEGLKRVEVLMEEADGKAR